LKENLKIGEIGYLIYEKHQNLELAKEDSEMLVSLGYHSFVATNVLSNEKKEILYTEHIVFRSEVKR